ncbi:hypothetical protein PCASD_18679 [Puccinia coronata f. sp. avenae]|uniref:Uncharacterized protein n=1 Tax=Puccinia coronata f. sp. avenae TaxID=200324 RepID=A0A2N5SWV8_9BASI|nr:hypothetical protein PCASD_18679 [Puccinia coronata f. sp. avenae]
MLVTRSPKAVEKWLNDIVLNGLGWILSGLTTLLLASSSQRNLVNQAAAPFRVRFAPVNTQRQSVITPSTNGVQFDNSGAYKFYDQVCSMRITPRQRSAPSDHVPSLKECQSWPLNYTIQCILETSLTAPIILGAWSSLRTAKASIGLAPLAQFMPINAWLTTTTSIL